MTSHEEPEYPPLEQEPDPKLSKSQVRIEGDEGTWEAFHVVAMDI